MGRTRTVIEPSSPRKFTASYDFRCGCCEERYAAGTLATYARGGELVAVECPNLPDAEPNMLVSLTRHGSEGDGAYLPTEAEQEEARRNRCNNCFLVHAPHQKECA